jgi:hypothetical protein
MNLKIHFSQTTCQQTTKTPTKHIPLVKIVTQTYLPTYSRNLIFLDSKTQQTIIHSPKPKRTQIENMNIIPTMITKSIKIQNPMIAHP